MLSCKRCKINNSESENRYQKSKLISQPIYIEISLHMGKGIFSDVACLPPSFNNGMLDMKYIVHGSKIKIHLNSKLAETNVKFRPAFTIHYQNGTQRSF